MSAIKGAGAILSIASAVSGSAATATAATNANPCVVTATNSFTNGEIIVAPANSFAGMVQLNNRAFVASAVSGTQVTLKGVDATAYGAYTSGGSLQGYTMIPVGNIADIKGFQGQASDIDVSNLLSVAKEYIVGLQDYGSVDMTGFLITGSTDAGQAMLRTVKGTQTLWPFSIQLSDGTVSAFMAYVKQFGFEGVKPEGAIGIMVVLRISSAPAWFA